MEWIKNNILAVLGGGGALLFLAIAWRRLWALGVWLWDANKRIQATKDELHVTDQALIVLRAKERDDARTESADLRRQLADRIREDDARDDIHRQARLTVRILKRICDEHQCICMEHREPRAIKRGVDYSEIEEEVRQAMK